MLLSILALLVTVATAAPANVAANSESIRDIPNYPGLRFNANKPFSITIFSDLHFGEPYDAQNRANGDMRTVGMMKSILNDEQPDLVVLNGDLISCEWVASADVPKLIDQIVSPIAEHKLPFATTFGNHDASRTCSTKAMSEYMWGKFRGNDNRQLSFTTQSVAGSAADVGVSNYYIPVYNSTNPEKLSLLLWFFDSRGGRVFQSDAGDVPVDDWVNEDVVLWFQKTRNQLFSQNGGSVPSIAFVHIPIQAMAAFQGTKRTPTTEPGINDERIGHQSDCDQAENCWSQHDVPFMNALSETEGLMAVFSGHDHGVDWCMKWAMNNRTHLCFNRHSGFGGYGDRWKRGARQVVVQEGDLSPRTWIKLEDHSISARVTLNSTYGTDQYPEVRSSTTGL